MEGLALLPPATQAYIPEAHSTGSASSVLSSSPFSIYSWRGGENSCVVQGRRDGLGKTELCVHKAKVLVKWGIPNQSKIPHFLVILGVWGGVERGVFSLILRGNLLEPAFPKGKTVITRGKSLLSACDAPCPGSLGWCEARVSPGLGMRVLRCCVSSAFLRWPVEHTRPGEPGRPGFQPQFCLMPEHGQNGSHTVWRQLCRLLLEDMGL